jgi:hypothetical protein
VVGGRGGGRCWWFVGGGGGVGGWWVVVWGGSVAPRHLSGRHARPGRQARHATVSHPPLRPETRRIITARSLPYVPCCNYRRVISYAHTTTRRAGLLRLKDDLSEKLNPFSAGRPRCGSTHSHRSRRDIRRDIEQRCRTPWCSSRRVASYPASEFCMIQRAGVVPEPSRQRHRVQLSRLRSRRQGRFHPDASTSSLRRARRDALTGERGKRSSTGREGLTTKCVNSGKRRRRSTSRDVRNKDVKQPWENVKTRSTRKARGLQIDLPSRFRHGHIPRSVGKGTRLRPVAVWRTTLLRTGSWRSRSRLAHRSITLRSALL